MAAFSFPSYLSTPASNNNTITRVSARLPNVSHQHLAFSSSIASSSSTLKWPLISLPAPSNTTLNKGEIVADNHFRFHPSERPRSLKAIRTLMHAAKYKNLGKSQKKAYKVAVEQLMAERVVVMEDIKDYNAIKEFIKKGVWVPDFMIENETNPHFRDKLQTITLKLKNKLRREEEKLMKKH
ncbi:hypothetical protein ACFX2C_008997 [Malus domestica]